MSNRSTTLRFTLAFLLLAFVLDACSRTTLDAMVAASTRDAATLDANTGGDLAADTGDLGVDTKNACPLPARKPGDTTVTIQMGGGERSYLLHLPSTYTGQTPVPLILDFHAISGTGGLQRATSPYPAVTDPEGVVMAFPTGVAGPIGTAWNAGACCVDKGVDDVAFARAIVTQIRETTCIDPKRVYAVGISMGGGMAYYLACRAADVFAAVAPFSFDLFRESLPDCIPARPITVISFRGTLDKLIPYAGGPSSVVPGMPVDFLGAQGTFQKWAEIDQCTGPASAEDGDGCSFYSTCKDGVEVGLCTKQGGGQETGNPNVAWKVLKRHTLP